jgi:hypothetical protein
MLPFSLSFGHQKLFMITRYIKGFGHTKSEQYYRIRNSNLGVRWMPYKDREQQKAYLRSYLKRKGKGTEYKREYRKFKRDQQTRLTEAITLKKDINLAASILQQKPKLSLYRSTMFRTTYRDVTKRTQNVLGLIDSNRGKRTRRR